jgi:hypothetical protein
MPEYRDYKGVMVEASVDQRVVVASLFNDAIVWSHDGSGRHMVRYCLQAKFFSDEHASLHAAHEFGECVRHYAEYLGLLD